MRLYVTGLDDSINSVSLQALFAKFGIVMEANVVTDQESGRSQGFGFVHMPDANHARQAILCLADTLLLGRRLTIQEARPRESWIGRTSSSGN